MLPPEVNGHIAVTSLAEPFRPPIPRRLSRWTTPLSAVLLAALLAVVPGGDDRAAAAPPPQADRSSETIRIVQANLLSGQPVPRFQADVGRVLATEPDFITYNEVDYRNDSVLAPGHYDLHRTHKNRYTAATPVAWRSDRWRPRRTGTTMLTDKWGKDPGKSVHLGVRYANWATLEHRHNGRVISVVSVHFPPKSRHTEGLKVVAARRLADLVRSLGKAGPVLVGGDLNIHYPSRQYPDEIFDSAGLTSTFEITGKAPVTKEDHGSTIDYVLVRSRSKFAVAGQYTINQNSDHHALVVDLRPTYPAPNAPQPTIRPGTVQNIPGGSHVEKRRVIRLMIDAVDNAPRGAGIHFDAAGIRDPQLLDALRRAHHRGVYVQVINRGKVWIRAEHELRDLLGTDVSSRTFAVPCKRLCQRVIAREGAPAARLLISKSGNVSAVTILANRAPIPRLANQPTTAWIRTSLDRYNRAFANFLELVGRKL